jgi:hypothetical protein
LFPDTLCLADEDWSFISSVIKSRFLANLQKSIAIELPIKEKKTNQKAKSKRQRYGGRIRRKPSAPILIAQTQPNNSTKTSETVNQPIKSTKTSKIANLLNTSANDEEVYLRNQYRDITGKPYRLKSGCKFNVLTLYASA